MSSEYLEKMNQKNLKNNNMYNRLISVLCLIGYILFFGMCIFSDTEIEVIRNGLLGIMYLIFLNNNKL